MKKKRALKKLVQWVVLGLCGYGVLTTLIYGQDFIDNQKGIYDYSWSGLDALVNKEDFGFFTNREVKTALNGIDGPYLFNTIRFNVGVDNNLQRSVGDTSQLLQVIVNNEDHDSFAVRLKTPRQQPDTYAMPQRLLAVSDIEGNFNALYSFLLNNGVMDAHYNWTFGSGHVVLNGDFMDRGSSVTQVLWLIYMLEAKAERAGGKVHFILGNHEIMNLYGDISYADFRYIEVAKQISGEQQWNKAAQFLYSSTSELGKWLRTKNVVEKIGDYIFVHAGLGPKLMASDMGIAEINSIAKKYYGVRADKKNLSRKENLVLSSYYSPYWDRSLALSWLYKGVFLLKDPLHANYHKTTQAELEDILKFYKVSKMVIGHSVVDNVTADYEGKVLRIDVKHGPQKNSELTQGLLVENGVECRIDGQGKRVAI